MPYNEEFYKKYRLYLLEPAVRKAHSFMFEQFHRFIGQYTRPRVIDLGCGTCELKTYDVPYERYAGFDIYPVDDQVIVADFTKMPPMALPTLAGFNPNIFTSLFSIEPMLEDRQRYELYEQLFRQIPSLHFGLVSGFIYRKRSYYHSVEENGGIRSFQTIEKQFDVLNPTFTEFRSYIEVPSEFFGKDVIEVWKFFRRASDAVHLVLRGNGNPGVHHSNVAGPQDNRCDTQTTIHGSTPVCDPGDRVWGPAPVVPVEEPATVGAGKMTAWAFFLLLLGLASMIFGMQFGLIGMAIGGAIGILVVIKSGNAIYPLERWWRKVKAGLVRVRKFLLNKSDPDYVPPKEWKPTPKPWFDKVHAVIYKTYTKVCCYFNRHDPINIMENGHLFTRCEHCNQFIEAVLWNVRKKHDTQKPAEDTGPRVSPGGACDGGGAAST